MNGIRLILFLTVCLSTGSSLSMMVPPSHINTDAGDTHPVFTPDFDRLDIEFYQALTANSLDPLKAFCSKCEWDLMLVESILQEIPQRLHDRNCAEYNKALLSAGDRAHYHAWWSNFIDNNFKGSFGRGDDSYFVAKVIIDQDIHNTVADNPIARLDLLLPYMKHNTQNKENALEYLAMHYALENKNTTVVKYLKAYIKNGPLNSPEQPTPSNMPPTQDTGKTPLIPLLDECHTDDTQADDDTDIEQDPVHDEPVADHIPQPQHFKFTPRAVIITLTCCIGGAVLIKKCHDWYCDSREPHFDDELDTALSEEIKK